MTAAPDHCLIVGAQKAGTTSVYEYLVSRDDVGAAKTKEPHYFDVTPQASMSPRDYRQTVFPDREGSARLSVESTPAYFQFPYVAAAIHSVLPGAKIVVCLRDPVRRAFSAWWMFAARGDERRTFEDAVAEELTHGPTIEDLMDPGLARRVCEGSLEARRRGELLDPLYLCSGLYAAHLGAYLDHFDRAQVLVLFQEEFAQDPATAMEQLLGFLALDRSTVGAAFARHNETPGTRVARARRIFHRTPGLRRLRRALPSSARRAVTSRLSRADGPPALQPATASALRDHFRPSDERLARMLGRSLPW